MVVLAVAVVLLHKLDLLTALVEQLHHLDKVTQAETALLIMQLIETVAVVVVQAQLVLLQQVHSAEMVEQVLHPQFLEHLLGMQAAAEAAVVLLALERRAAETALHHLQDLMAQLTVAEVLEVVVKAVSLLGITAVQE
jgi:hypothetical protein